MKKPDCFTNEVRKALKAALSDLDKRAFPSQPQPAAAAGGGAASSPERQQQQQQVFGGPAPPKILPLYDGTEHPTGSVFVCHPHGGVTDFAQNGVLLVEGGWQGFRVLGWQWIRVLGC